MRLKIYTMLDVKTLVLKLISKVYNGDLKGDESLYKVLLNMNWLALESVFRTGVSLFVLAWVARYLGPEQFGEYNYAFAFVTLFSVLGTLGLDSIAVRSLVRSKKGENKILGSTFVLRAAGSILMIFLSLFTAWNTERSDTQLFLFTFIFALSYAGKSFEVIDYYFQSEVKSKFSVYARSLGFFTGALVKIVLILTSAPLISFVITVLLEQLVSIGLFIYFYNRRSLSSIIKWRVDIATIKAILSDSWPLALGAMASMVYMRIDQIMIGSMLSKLDLGYYLSAVKLSEATNFIPVAISTSVFPLIVLAKKESEGSYLSSMQRYFDIIVWLGIILSLVISLGAPIIVKIFGDQYIHSGPILRVHVWSSLFIFIGAIASRWVITENLTRNALVRTVLAAILNIVLNYLLIPRLGIMGAAIATVVSYAFVNFISLLLARSTLPCFLMALRAFNIIKVIRRIKNGYK